MTETLDEAGDDGFDTGHVDELRDGCGCAEVWEHLSEVREADEPDAGVE